MNTPDTIAIAVSFITAAVALARVLVSERNMRAQQKQIDAQVKQVEANILEKYKRIASEATSELMDVSSSLRKAERDILEMQRKINELEQANGDLAMRVAHLEGENKTLVRRLEEAYEAIRILLRGISILTRQLERSEIHPAWRPPKDFSSMVNTKSTGSTADIGGAYDRE